MAKGTDILIQAMLNISADREKRVNQYAQLLADAEKRKPGSSTESIRLLEQREAALRKDKVELFKLRETAFSRDQKLKAGFTNEVLKILNDRTERVEKEGKNISTTTRVSDKVVTDKTGKDFQTGVSFGTTRGVTRALSEGVGNVSTPDQLASAIAEVSYGDLRGNVERVRGDSTKEEGLRSAAHKGMLEVATAVLSGNEKVLDATLLEINKGLPAGADPYIKGTKRATSAAANVIARGAFESTMPRLQLDTTLPGAAPSAPAADGQPQRTSSTSTTVSRKVLDTEKLEELDEERLKVAAQLIDRTPEEVATEIEAGQKDPNAYTDETKRTAITLAYLEGHDDLSELFEESPARAQDYLKQAAMMGQSERRLISSPTFVEQADEINARSKRLHTERKKSDEYVAPRPGDLLRQATLSEFRASGGKKSINANRIINMIDQAGVTDPAQKAALVDQMAKDFGFKPRQIARLKRKLDLDRVDVVGMTPPPEEEAVTPTAPESLPEAPVTVPEGEGTPAPAESSAVVPEGSSSQSVNPWTPEQSRALDEGRDLDDAPNQPATPDEDFASQVLRIEDAQGAVGMGARKYTNTKIRQEGEAAGNVLAFSANAHTGSLDRKEQLAQMDEVITRAIDATKLPPSSREQLLASREQLAAYAKMSLAKGESLDRTQMDKIAPHVGYNNEAFSAAVIMATYDAQNS